MATVKKTPETEVQTVEQPVNEWDEKRTIRLPRAGKNEEKTVFVCVNGRVFYVPKGKPVEVPLPIYEALMRKDAAQAAEIEYASTIPNEG